LISVDRIDNTDAIILYTTIKGGLSDMKKLTVHSIEIEKLPLSVQAKNCLIKTSIYSSDGLLALAQTELVGRKI